MQFSKIIQRVIELGQEARKETDEAKRRKLKVEIKAFVESHKPGEIYLLTTIMYLGRGDFNVADLASHYQGMYKKFAKPEYAARQMLEKGPMPGYLQTGLRKLEEAGVDVDTLPSSHVDAPPAHPDNDDELKLVVGPWRCDTCGEIIDKPEDGMIRWLVQPKGDHKMAGRDIRIVHGVTKSPLDGAEGCYADESLEDGWDISDECLGRMLGPDGLVRLLALIEDGVLPAGDVSRIIMRLFVPGYERARPYFQKALQDDIVDAGMSTDYFYQDDLRHIIANATKLAE